MAAGGQWFVATFSVEQGFGRIKEAASGEEAVFGLESWAPCDPVTGRNIQDSDARRDSLLPIAGEAVDVEWKTSRLGKVVPARVLRRLTMEPMPTLPFAQWLAALANVIPALADWSAREWDAVFASEAGEIEDAVRASEPATSPSHVAVLAWIGARGPAELVARRLGWLSATPRDGAFAVEALDGDVFLELAPAVVERLVRERLVVPAGQ